MESFLKKKARAHKYLAKLTASEINAIIDKHVPHLRSIQIYNLKNHPEIQDEYLERVEKIVQEVRADLQDKFRSKIKITPGSEERMQAINYWLNSI